MILAADEGGPEEHQRMGWKTREGRERKGWWDGPVGWASCFRSWVSRVAGGHGAREGHLSTSGSIVDGSGDSGSQRECCPVRKLLQGCRPGTSVGPSPQVVTAEAVQVVGLFRK